MSSIQWDDSKVSIAVASGLVLGYTLSNLLSSSSSSSSSSSFSSSTVTPSATKESVSKVAGDYPRPAGTVFRYGTAGFRMNEALLDSTCLRMGMLATLRSLKTGVPVGIMVTASHNGPLDNGLKLTDCDGGMLTASWEGYATQLANAKAKDVYDVLIDIIAKEKMPYIFRQFPKERNAKIYLGMDTRAHSVRLAECCKVGAECLGAVVEHIGIVTTPQLHHCVYNNNRADKWDGLDGFYAKVEYYFKGLLRNVKDMNGTSEKRGSLVIDCANGVGGPRMEPLIPKLKGYLNVELRNNGNLELLNSKCGAEHCQKKRLPPLSCSGESDKGIRFASYDGDADRVVFFYFDKTGAFRLLDGDKIAVLTARWINKQLKLAGYKKGDVRLGIVQTAYANGAASMVVKQDDIEAPYAKTGVKYLHHKALDYDIGVYFEANGHGTVLFSEKTMDQFKKRMAQPRPKVQKEAYTNLYYASQLFNQAVGDAICDALFVEAILTTQDMSVEDWDALYTDLPSRQTKVKVADRTLLKPISDETRLTEPSALQQKIDSAVKSVKNGRAFARPSGTEDVCRVYAEAATQTEADLLASIVAEAIYDEAQGVGGKPSGKWW